MVATRYDLRVCGIAGLIHLKASPSQPADHLGAMLDRVAHRGPDGRDMSVHGACHLAHARLAIIDLLSGHQPMHLPAQDDHPGLHLVFNGEVYNHRELRKTLTRRGHRFASNHSDTEVLLLGYRQWGTQLPKHLHGMFAFAIWDEHNQELFLCRDRSGKKPLYLYRTEDRLLFASLIPGILAGLPGQTPAIDPDALLNYLRFGYPFAGSMFQGIQEVPPAYWMKVHHDGKTECERYWRPPPISKHSTSLGAVDALEEVLGESVEQRLEADVPLGCFLSGGIDSSVVAALATRTLRKRNEDPLQTFCVRMPDAEYDETTYATHVAKHLQSKLTVLDTPVADCMTDLEYLMQIIGEPTADSSLLPTHWLCRAASQHVRVALSGDGGDELFGGYDRYRAMRMLQKHRPWLNRVPTRALASAKPRSTPARLRRLLQAAQAGQDPARQYQAMVVLFPERDIARLAPGRFDAALDPGVPPVPDWPDIADHAHAAMRWDFEHYLPHELLRKIDRAAMAVPIEVRSPMLGTHVMDLAGHLPPSVLMPRNRAKGLLRELAARYLPSEITRRPKRGFAAPIGQWFRGRLRDPLHDRLLQGPLDAFGIDVSFVQHLLTQHDQRVADHTHRLFALLQLSLWLTYLQSPSSISTSALPPETPA